MVRSFGLLAALSVSGLVLAPAHVEAAKMLTDHGERHHLAVLLGLAGEEPFAENKKEDNSLQLGREMAQGSQGLSFALVSRGTVVLAEHA